jgi:lysozyme
MFKSLVLFAGLVLFSLNLFASDASVLAAEIIKVHEGFSPTWYTCPGGKRTIGYGETDYNQAQITKQQAEALLNKRTVQIEKDLTAMVRVPLTIGEKAALISFVYNFGVPKFKKSKILELINQGKKDQIPAQLVRWVYARVDGRMQVLRGLVKRRNVEVELWNYGKA